MICAMGIVTISASYGTASAQVGPAVARALHLPFVDRAIPQAVARALGVPLSEAEEQDGKAATGMWRLISSIAMVPDLTGGEHLVYNKVADERLFKEKTEQVLRQVADGPGGVILGRCAVLVLRDRPDALHVRLDGPIEERVTLLSKVKDLDRDEARKQIESTDRARKAYAHSFYKCDLNDARHYQLVIDATAFPTEDVTDMIVRAARARGIHPVE